MRKIIDRLVPCIACGDRRGHPDLELCAICTFGDGDAEPFEVGEEMTDAGQSDHAEPPTIGITFKVNPKENPEVK